VSSVSDANTTPATQRGRKETQRERLLAGMVKTASQSGYARTTVSSVIAHAGVSRPTFYDYFTDKDDCFLAALSTVHELLMPNIGEAIAAEQPERAIEMALRELIVFSRSEPAMARLLTNETLSGGQCALDARAEGIAALAAVVESAHGEMASTAKAPDIPAEIALGAVYRLLSTRLRRGERALAGLQEDVTRWVRSYEAPLIEHCWRLDCGHPALPHSPLLAKTVTRPPPPLPPGRPRVSEEEVAENHRLRIMLATATLAAEKGYGATTVADIVKRAGLDARAFYKSFAEKQDAFMAAHELGFQELMAVTAGAFFAGTNWPERTWEAGRAFTQFLECNPTIARAGFVEAYAVGLDAVERVENSHVAFTIFLREGYQFRPNAHPPSPVALEAIIAAIFEIVHRQARDRGELGLSGLLPSMAHLCLTPFLGSSKTNEFVNRKLARDR
jgi:AcrR family transcriptional regulator